MLSLDQSRFYQTLAKLWLPVFNKELTLKRDGNFKKLSGTETFVLAVMEHTNRLLYHLDSLLLPLEYIKVETMPKKYDDPKMRDNYYIYHYENHVIRISSIFDYCLLLVNIVYRLGNPPKLVNFLLVIENQNVSDQTKRTLKNLSKKIQHIKFERNKMIHQGDFINETVQGIIDNNLHWDLTSLPKDQTLSAFFTNRKHTKKTTLIELMENDLKVLHIEINNVFDSLIENLENTLNDSKF